MFLPYYVTITGRSPLSESLLQDSFLFGRKSRISLLPSFHYGKIGAVKGEEQMFLEDSLYNGSVQDLISKIFLTLLVMFLFGCMLGYGLEVLFRRIFTAHKWVNPGFMKGPWLPLYGFGVVIMFFFCFLLLVYLPKDWVFYNPLGEIFGRKGVHGPTVYDLVIILCMTLGLILLEFFAGLIFVKGFKVRLWDYSNMKGNILGIICPVFNLVWFAVAVFYYYACNPFFYRGFSVTFDYMFGESGQEAHFWFIFWIGVVYGVFLVDLVDSLNIFNRIAKMTKHSKFVTRYETQRDVQRQKSKEARKKFYDSLPQSIKSAHDAEVAGKKKLASFVAKAVMIDPSKSSDVQQNYDANGRPVVEEGSKALVGKEETKEETSETEKK